MNVNVTRPCDNCPFRKVGAIELRPGRLEELILNLTASDDKAFLCHKTLDLPASKRDSQCAGAMIYLLKAGNPSVTMRIASAVELLHYDKLLAYADTIIEPASMGVRLLEFLMEQETTNANAKSRHRKGRPCPKPLT